VSIAAVTLMSCLCIVKQHRYISVSALAALGTGGAQPSLREHPLGALYPGHHGRGAGGDAHQPREHARERALWFGADDAQNSRVRLAGWLVLPDLGKGRERGGGRREGEGRVEGGRGGWARPGKERRAHIVPPQVAQGCRLREEWEWGMSREPGARGEPVKEIAVARRLEHVDRRDEQRGKDARDGARDEGGGEGAFLESGDGAESAGKRLVRPPVEGAEGDVAAKRWEQPAEPGGRGGVGKGAWGERSGERAWGERSKQGDGPARTSWAASLALPEMSRAQCAVENADGREGRAPLL
jgi:hypothetical protein